MNCHMADCKNAIRYARHTIQLHPTKQQSTGLDYDNATSDTQTQLMSLAIALEECFDPPLNFKPRSIDTNCMTILIK